MGTWIKPRKKVGIWPGAVAAVRYPRIGLAARSTKIEARAALRVCCFRGAIAFFQYGRRCVKRRRTRPKKQDEDDDTKRLVQLVEDRLIERRV